MLFVSVVVVGILPSGAAAAGWSLLHTPNAQQPQGALIGVSCSAANACMAVGTGRQKTLAERWNGSRWAIEPSPNPSASSSALQAVSCTSATSCMTVGISGGAPLAERWNGSSWTVHATPKPSGAFFAILRGVSCSSASSCTAVGSFSNSSAVSPQSPLAERWNGTSWVLEAAPRPSGAQSSQLLGVSCTSASSCIAVGESFTSSGTATMLAERWNGTSWAIQQTRVPSGALSSELNAVSCSSASSCTAVGFFVTRSSNGALAEHWNGTSWAVQPIPHPSGASSPVLLGVSCSSASICIAVGRFLASGNYVLLAERWNGSSWAVESTPKPSGRPYGALNGVSCRSVTACTAVGGAQKEGTGGLSSTLAERWNGSAWAVQSTPNPLATLSSDLSGVSCSSASACTAVGGADEPLAERWNGSGWAIQPTPNPSGASFGLLSGVSCTSASACIAVGSAGTTVAGTALAEVWNGSSWTIQRTPVPSGAQGSELDGVSCTSASSCIAVGDFTNSSGAVVTLAEDWNGSSWAIQATPVPSGAQLSVLYGVSCSSPSACTAVGSSGAGGPNAPATLAEVWDGSSWAIQTTPNPSGAQGSGLSGVSCTSASECIAVGSATDTSFNTAAVAEHWDGTSWAIQSTPTSGSSGLSDVSCISASECIAVGGGGGATLAELWNGSSWAIQPTPNASGATSNSLSGVSCTSATACMAAGGSYHANNTFTTLTERFTG